MEILYQWHIQDPANSAEIDRTWMIAPYQQNKPNPYILDSSLVQRAYFQSENIVGDINLDSVIDVLDVIQIVNISVGTQDFNLAADLNEDGLLNVQDIILLVNLILS